ncbi:hypothetical protein LSUB1_G005890 [Lachnellula subtilissima]|uniref:Zn(2)-C6 fungal-type domain-containing protein n=1 Tax=Lachnellula subtilissima TaxID=602034 RepID=A0A8H8RQE4_9HELO|nr:hypothetical protein LSUB1_G005890 [Lachnellula subtilissima]
MAGINGPPRSLKHRNQPQQNVQSQIEPGSYPTEMILDGTTSGYTATTSDMMYDTGYSGEPGYYIDVAGSEKQGSNPDAMSFVNLAGTSVMTHTSSSYVMVRKRVNSNESNGTSAEGSENQMYSVPPSCGSADWHHGADFAVDMDPAEEDPFQTMAPHDPKNLLSGMYSPGMSFLNLPTFHKLIGSEPRPIPNPYSPEETVSANSGSPASHEYIDNYTTNSMDQSRTFTLPSRSSDDPWTHYEPYRVPRFDPGYTVFAPSPGPAVENDQEEVRSGLSMQKVNSRNHGPRSMKSIYKGKERVKERGWEHAVVQKGGLQLILNREEQTSQRGGCRKGKLDPEAAEKARKIRRITACWNCWIQKVPCSEGKPCDRCKKQFSPSANNLCCRSHFKEYESALFPEYLHSHFKKRKIEDLFNEHTSGFSDTVLEIDIATGECFKPMRLSANVFKPQSWELLSQHRLTTEQEEQNSPLVLQISAPVGLLGLSTPEMKDKCKEHVAEMIANPEYVEQVTAGCNSLIPYSILAAATQFSKCKDVPLVHNVLMLHAINYFMKTLITFSEESARSVYQTIQPFGGALEPYLSSRLLSRQIKYAMHKLSREITVEVLEGLERSMRSRTKDSWPVSFCAFLVLCLCMEGLQIACDIYVVCDIEKCQKDGSNSAYNRFQSHQASTVIDENPFSQCQRLFHDIYKSHKESNRGAREAGFNPLRNLANNDRNTGLEPAADVMVKSIYQMICQSYPEIIDLSERPPLVNNGYSFDPESIKINGTGRLVSKFLRSFFPDHYWPAA